MPADDAADTAPDPGLRPVWEDDADDPVTTAAAADPAAWPRRPWVLPPCPAGPDAAAEALLAPLAAAQDALARLDARADAVPEPLRAGLIARLAYCEAAGWLAVRGAWVHPRDDAARPGADRAVCRRSPAALPASCRTPQRPWASFGMPPRAISLASWTAAPDTVPWPRLAREDAVTRALALARLLTVLPRRHDPLADPATAATPPAAAVGRRRSGPGGTAILQAHPSRQCWQYHATGPARRGAGPVATRSRAGRIVLFCLPGRCRISMLSPCSWRPKQMLPRFASPLRQVGTCRPQFKL